MHSVGLLWCKMLCSLGTETCLVESFVWAHRGSSPFPQFVGSQFKLIYFHFAIILWSEFVLFQECKLQMGEKNRKGWKGKGIPTEFSGITQVSNSICWILVQVGICWHFHVIIWTGGNPTQLNQGGSDFGHCLRGWQNKFCKAQSSLILIPVLTGVIIILVMPVLRNAIIMLVLNREVWYQFLRSGNMALL